MWRGGGGMGRRGIYITGGLVLLLGLAPVLSVILSSLIAEARGCALHEGGISPCTLAGQDIGPALYAMFVAGWLLFLTWPLVLVGLGMIVVTGLIDLLRWARSR